MFIPILAAMALHATVEEQSCFEQTGIPEIDHPAYYCDELQESDEVYIAAVNGGAQFVILVLDEGDWFVTTFGKFHGGRFDLQYAQTRFSQGPVSAKRAEKFRNKVLAGSFDKMKEPQAFPPKGADLICVSWTELVVFARSSDRHLSGERNSCRGLTMADEYAEELRKIAISADPKMKKYLRLIGE